MDASIPEGWTDFGVAAAGATAALAGLLIVAMSVNVAQILASKAIIQGARSMIASLVLAIAVSLLMLPSEQTLLAFGVETLLLTAIAAAVQLGSILSQWRSQDEGITSGVRAFIALLAFAQYAPFLVGSVLLIVGISSGLWGVIAGVVVVVIASMINGWVLLIEVRR